MRDINKELEKFYALLDALETDENQQQKASSPDSASDQPTQNQQVSNGQAERTGVFPGKSLRTPNKTIESKAPTAEQKPASVPPAMRPAAASPPKSVAPAPPTANRAPTNATKAAEAPRIPNGRPVQPPIGSQPKAPATAAPPAAPNSSMRPASAPVARPVQPAAQQRRTPKPTVQPSRPVAQADQKLSANGALAGDRKPIAGNARPAESASERSPNAAAKPSTPVPGAKPVQARSAIARPAPTQPQPNDPHFAPRAERPSAADIRPAAPSQARSTPPNTAGASQQKIAGSDESWNRKVKLPTVSGPDDARHGARRDLDSLVSDVKTGLNKRQAQDATPQAENAPTYVPSTKFSAETANASSRRPEVRNIPPELLELPVDETPARSRFTLAAAAIALVVPTVLAGILVFNMSGDPNSVDMVASSTLENGKAVLTMTTEPAGARVYLNNSLIGVTPFSGVKVDPGDYLVTTEKEGFLQADTVLRITGTERIAFNLKRAGGLDLESGINGGHILSGLVAADSSVLDQTPSEVDDSAQDRAPLFERTEPTPSEVVAEEPVTRRRPQVGGLVLTSDPAGAKIWVNNQERGETPATLKDLPIGSYEIKLTKPGYDTYSADLRVSPSIATPYHSKLRPLLGTIVVSLTEQSDLYLDGEQIEQGVSGTRRFEVSAGQHTLRAVAGTLGAKEIPVSVTAGDESAVSISFEAEAVSQLIGEAAKLFGAGEYEASKELYGKALALQPNNPLADAKVKEIDRLLSSVHEQELTDAIIEDGVYLVVDSSPQLEGGLEELHRNVVFPDAAFRAGVKGRVYIQFIVDENGKPSDFSVTKGLPLGCNDAAIAAIAKSKFKPGQFRGRSVKSRHTLFVNFGN